MRMGKKVVVMGFFGAMMLAATGSVEAQRVAFRAKTPAVKIKVRVGPPAPRVNVLHARVHSVRAPRPGYAAAVRCDLREDIADAREDRRDRAEDIADAREDYWDAQHNGGWRDRLEDVADRAEDRRDRAEDVRDRREDRWDRTHIGCRRF